MRALIEALLEEELEATLGRRRFERGASSNGRRHGHRPRQLVTTFRPLTLSVPRARRADQAGEREWASTLLPAYRRLSHGAEALIAELYLAGMNTRRAGRVRTAALEAVRTGRLVAAGGRAKKVAGSPFEQRGRTSRMSFRYAPPGP